MSGQTLSRYSVLDKKFQLPANENRPLNVHRTFPRLTPLTPACEPQIHCQISSSTDPRKTLAGKFFFRDNQTRWCSLLTFSTLQRPLRPRSTSSRPLFLSPDPSSWTSSAPAASPSPPFSLTPRPLSSARDAPPSCASLPVVRPD